MINFNKINIEIYELLTKISIVKSYLQFKINFDYC